MSGNRLFDALPPTDRERLLASAEVVELARRQTNYAEGGAYAHVHFPIDAVLSVVSTMENGSSCEVGTVGREGFSECDAVLDESRARRTSFCQIPGRAVRMSPATFAGEVAENGAFAKLMRRNVSARLFCAEQFAACNLLHALTARCARWLLMMRDRVASEQFPITHEFLSIMLGVRRAGVSKAAASLHAAGAITYRRGVLTIVDGGALERAACECYGRTKTAFDEALAPRAGDPAVHAAGGVVSVSRNGR